MEIDWDEYRAFNGRVDKSQIIILKKTIAKISNSDLTASELAKKKRTWTDSSGQHKIQANFVSKTESDVTLRLEDGEQKTVPLDKLSEADRELLQGLKKEVENPFSK